MPGRDPARIILEVWKKRYTLSNNTIPFPLFNSLISIVNNFSMAKLKEQAEELQLRETHFREELVSSEAKVKLLQDEIEILLNRRASIEGQSRQLELIAMSLEKTHSILNDTVASLVVRFNLLKQHEAQSADMLAHCVLARDVVNGLLKDLRHIEERIASIRSHLENAINNTLSPAFDPIKTPYSYRRKLHLTLLHAELCKAFAQFGSPNYLISNTPYLREALAHAIFGAKIQEREYNDFIPLDEKIYHADLACSHLPAQITAKGQAIARLSAQKAALEEEIAELTRTAVQPAVALPQPLPLEHDARVALEQYSRYAGKVYRAEEKRRATVQVLNDLESGLRELQRLSGRADFDEMIQWISAFHHAVQKTKDAIDPAVHSLSITAESKLDVATCSAIQKTALLCKEALRRADWMAYVVVPSPSFFNRTRTAVVQPAAAANPPGLVTR